MRHPAMAGPLLLALAPGSSEARPQASRPLSRPQRGRPAPTTIASTLPPTCAKCRCRGEATLAAHLLSLSGVLGPPRMMAPVLHLDLTGATRLESRRPLNLFFYPMKKFSLIFALLVLPVQGVALAQAQYPLIFADVPDMSMIRVGKNYYMSSTTMHMYPGVPIMKSTDLVNWKIINYAGDKLADMPELNLTDEKKRIQQRHMGQQSALP